MRVSGSAIALWTGIWLVLLSGCTQWYARQADKAATGAIQSADRKALGTTQPFDVTYRPFARCGDPNNRTIQIGKKTIYLGTGPAQKLTPLEALEIAFRNSRGLQDKTEQLFSQALATSSGRQSWDYPMLGGEITADATHTKVNDGHEDNVGTVSPDLSLTQKLVNGGVFTFAYGLDVLTDFAGAGGTTVGSLLEANFTQPLLQGAWHGFAYEDQYRAERDLLLAVYEYYRFRQTFAADIITRYYRLLQQQDLLTNQEKSIKRLDQTVIQTRVLVEGGQTSRIELDQAEQNRLNALIRLQRQRQDYHNQLDEFKITLGLPVAANVEGDYPEALELLLQKGLDPMKLNEEEAVSAALSTRPDLLTQRSDLRDAGRDVEMAADKFLPVLDVKLGFSAAGTKPREFYRTRFDDHTRTVGASFEYPLNQTGNRDTYRNSLLESEKAKRGFSEFLDTVVLEVRRSCRELEQSRKSYELQVRNVDLARRRRTLAALQQKEGQASARDVLEAEDALREAQNGLTEAAVGYATTRLKFLAELGLIEVDEKGALHERDKPFGFEKLERLYPYLGR